MKIVIKKLFNETQLVAMAINIFVAVFLMKGKGISNLRKAPTINMGVQNDVLTITSSNISVPFRRAGKKVSIIRL